MAVLTPWGTFHYTASVFSGASGTWRGCATPPSDPSAHPGLVGSSPEIEVADGVITIRRTEGWFGRQGNVLYLRRRRTASEVSIAVGSALATILQDGDVLSVFQTGTSDLGLTVFREGKLQAAAGAVSRVPLGDGIAVEEDARARDFRPSGIAATLDRRGCQLVWLDASEPDPGSHISSIVEAVGPRVVIAIAGGTAADRRRLHQLVASHSLAPHHSSHEYVDIPGNFAHAEQWLEHIRGLPTSRPRDLWIRIAAGPEPRQLGENEYTFAPPFHLFVLRIYRWGHPDELSQLAIVRDSPALSRHMVVETTELLAARTITVKP